MSGVPAQEASEPLMNPEPTIRQSKMVRAALHYAERGWPVLPLAPEGKTPLRGSRGVHDATTNETAIRNRWTRVSRANIGIATGGGLVVVDVDGDEGDAALATLEERNGPLPPTLTVTTGRDAAKHLYFEGDAPSAVLGEKLDLKGRGGYIVCPPSVHPNGRRYTFLNPGASVAPLPEWVARCVHAEPRGESLEPREAARQQAEATLLEAEATMRAAPKGRRNITLNGLAFLLGQYVATGDLDEERIRESLLRAAIGVGLPEGKSRRTINSGLAAGKANPRDVKNRAEYVLLVRRVWTDDGGLTSVVPAARFLYLALATMPGANSSGVFSVEPSAMERQTGLSGERLRAAVADLERVGLLRYSGKDGVAFLPRLPLEDPPVSPDNVRRWTKLLARVPACAVKSEAQAFLRAVAGRWAETISAPLVLDAKKKTRHRPHRRVWTTLRNGSKNAISRKTVPHPRTPDPVAGPLSSPAGPGERSEAEQERAEREGKVR